MNQQVKQSIFSKKLGELSMQMMKQPLEDRKVYFTSVMGVIQMLKCFDPICSNKVPTLAEKKMGLDKTIDFAKENGDSNVLLSICKSSGASVLYRYIVEKNHTKEEMDRLSETKENEVVKIQHETQKSMAEPRRGNEGSQGMAEWRKTVEPRANAVKTNVLPKNKMSI